MSQYRVSISPNGVSVVFGYKLDNQILGMVQSFSSDNFQTPVSQTQFASLDEAIRFFDSQPDTTEIAGEEIRGIFGDHFAVQKSATEYEFAEDPQAYLLSLANQRHSFFETIDLLSKEIPFSPNVDKLNEGVRLMQASLSEEHYAGWPDLGDAGVYLAFTEVSGLGERLVIVDLENRADVAKLAAMNIKPAPWSPRHSSGIYFLDSDKRSFRASDLGRAFGIEPCPMFRNHPKQQVVKDFERAYNQKTWQNYRHVMENSQTLGQNRFGHTVSQYGDFRYLFIGYGCLTEQGAANRGAYLRGTDEQGNIDKASLRECLLPVAQDILSGIQVSSRDLEKRGSVFLDKAALSDLDKYALQENLETVLYEAYGLMVNETESVSEQFELAKNIYLCQPKRNIRTDDTMGLGQYSTPVPMSFVAQQFLLAGDRPAKQSVLEPCIGNGGLINQLSRHSDFAVKGIELDPQRVNDAVRADIVIGDATTADFQSLNQGQQYDCVIANPPFGQLDHKIYHDGKIAVTRIDYLIALRTLDARKDHGRAVFIVGGDGPFSVGEPAGGSKFFYNYLFNHYQVEGLVELDSRLYQRNGANTNVRMIVVGDRRSEPLSSSERSAPQQFPVLKDYDELFTWSSGVIQALAQQERVAAVPVAIEAVPAGEDTQIEPQNQVKPETLVGPKTATAEPVIYDLFGFETEQETVPEVSATAQDDQIAVSDTDSIPNEAVPSSEAAPREERQVIELIAPDAELLDRKVDAAAFVEAVKRKENELQAPYNPSSTLGEASAMIPINMAASTYTAFEQIRSDYPDIDQYVCDKLQYESKEQLGSLYSPEQIDALALAIYSHEEKGRAIINADQTGLGKGRYMAGLMRYARVNGMTPVFVTYKPSLMSDIFRDIQDTGSMNMFQNIFSLNNQKINNYFDPSKPLMKPLSAAEHRRVIDSGSLPENTDIVMTTYSQLSNRYEKSKKTQFLESVGRSQDIFLLLDESHIASGESNIYANVALVMDTARGASFSSATALKTTKSFKLYKSIFPPSINTEMLPDILSAGGEGLQESVSNCLAADGVLICRQHDLSNLEIRNVEATAEQEQRNREISDQVAEILLEMTALSGDISAQVSQLNQDFKNQYDRLPDNAKAGQGRMQASSMNFGSRLYGTTRQFLMGIQVEQACQQAIDDLNNNIKPVIGVENTGESLLYALIDAHIFDEHEQIRFDELSEIPVKQMTEAQAEEYGKLLAKKTEKMENLILPDVPQFKDYLAMMLHRLRNVYVQDAYGVGRVDKLGGEAYDDIEEGILSKIEKLPNDIPLSPLDVLRTRLGEHGYSMGEVSGRSLYLQRINNPDGEHLPPVWQVNNIPEKNVTQTINGFQSGKVDSIAITKAGSTGFSMHADPLFADTRRRDFIALQKAANIADFLQWIGRVNRKGQVVPPLISNLSTGLPAELRLTMMHNAKLRKLSANVTSNRENKNIENQEVDFLNKIGDELALLYLVQNEHLAAQLDIRIPDGSSDIPPQSENYFVNRLMSRLVLLPVSQQEKIIEQLSTMFSEKLAELNAQGINPFKVDTFDWQAERVKTFTVASYTDLDTNSYFDAPLQVSTLEFEVKNNPMPVDEVNQMVESYLEEHASGQEFNKFLPIGTDIPADTHNIRQQKLQVVTASITQQLLNRCYNQLPAAVKREVGHVNNLHKFAPSWEGDPKFAKPLETYEQAMTAAKFSHFMVGAHFKVLTPLGETKTTKVVGYSFPEHGLDIAHMARTGIRVMIAGEDKVTRLNLASLHSQRMVFKERGEPPYLAGYNGQLCFEEEVKQALNSTRIKRVNVLENNLFKATEMALENKMGHPILYTDKDGVRQRAVLLKPEFSFDELTKLPAKMSSNKMMEYIAEYFNRYERGERMEQGKPMFHSRMSKHSRIGLNIAILATDSNSFQFIIHEPKSPASRQLLKDETIFEGRKGGKSGSMGLKMVGRSDRLQCSLTQYQLRSLLDNLAEGHKFGGLYLLNGEEKILQSMNSEPGQNKDANHTNGL
ncbi:hypothetical protein L1281_001703 [Neisseria sp. HSC-16F19]|nr:strawberry notch C-terminal domain-containing protein [Neisseria sp. HSC-16F19]MCP2041109.1 hypothetical protein [Neisseria sp. HSC-16F19]